MITVFTPTYNRGDMLTILYKSLLRQSCYDFEWLIVDDGSIDNTKELISSFITNGNPFEIRYIYQNNGGKHRAINKGVKCAKYPLFFIVDSDDYLIDTAIEKILLWVQELPQSQHWAGVAGSKGYSLIERIGGEYSDALYVDAKNTERKKKNLTGDRAEVYFTDILKQYPFPEFEGETFITEEIVWNRIAMNGFKLRWFNEIIYICDYLEDGLTRDKSKFERNPLGTLEWAQGQLIAYSHDFKERVRAIGTYYWAIHKRKRGGIIAKELHISIFELFYATIVYMCYKNIVRRL